MKRFSGQIFGDDHKHSPYFVSALSYYRIEQFFRSGDLKTEYKKARFQLMLLVRLIAMGENLPPFNSRKIENSCEEFKARLIQEEDSLALFTQAQEIFENSGIDLDKKQYKSESETELLLQAFRTYKNQCS